MTADLKLTDFNRNDRVVLIDGTTGTVFSKGTAKLVITTDDGRTLLVMPNQVRDLSVAR